MNHGDPRVSVILPVYNGEDFLAEALGSLPNRQDVLLEIIVIDDGSTDGTARIVDAWGPCCIYRKQPNAGPAAARNAGLRLANAPVVGFIDADDLWPAEKLETQLRYLDSHPEVDVVVGTVQWLRRVTGSDDFAPVGRPISGAQLGCGLFRRAVFDRVGLFDSSLRYSEDIDWLMRAREQGVTFAALPQVGLCYRHHESSMTYGKSTSSLNLLQVFKRSLDRRRGTGTP